MIAKLAKTYAVLKIFICLFVYLESTTGHSIQLNLPSVWIPASLAVKSLDSGALLLG